MNFQHKKNLLNSYLKIQKCPCDAQGFRQMWKMVNLSLNTTWWSFPVDMTMHCSADSAPLLLQCVPAAAAGHRCAHHTAALRPHEAEVPGVRPDTNASKLEVLDRILMNVNLLDVN